MPAGDRSGPARRMADDGRAIQEVERVLYRLGCPGVRCTRGIIAGAKNGRPAGAVEPASAHNPKDLGSPLLPRRQLASLRCPSSPSGPGTPRASPWRRRPTSTRCSPGRSSSTRPAISRARPRSTSRCCGRCPRPGACARTWARRGRGWGATRTRSTSTARRSSRRTTPRSAGTWRWRSSRPGRPARPRSRPSARSWPSRRTVTPCCSSPTAACGSARRRRPSTSCSRPRRRRPATRPSPTSSARLFSTRTAWATRRS